MATVGQSRETAAVQEDLVLGEYGAEQEKDVFDPQLLEELIHADVGDGQGMRQRRLQNLLISRADREPHLPSARRRYLDEAEDVADQTFQVIGKAFDVDGVDCPEAVLKKTETRLGQWRS